MGDPGWIPPILPNCKLNTDATKSRETQTSSIATIIKKIVKVRLIHFVQDVDSFEAMAVRDSLLLVRDVGFSSLEVGTDSAHVAALLCPELNDLSKQRRR